jgi:hypothetical protein
MNNIAIEEALLQLSDERKQIDALVCLMNAFRHKRVRDVSKTLKFAFMWLGRAKAALGAANPYINSKDPSSKIIEPGQDLVISFELPKDVDPESETSVVKYLRGAIDPIIKAIQNDQKLFSDKKEYQDALTNAWTYAYDAQMDLGLILGDIRISGERPPIQTKAPAAEKPVKVTETKQKEKGFMGKVKDILTGQKDEKLKQTVGSNKDESGSEGSDNTKSDTESSGAGSGENTTTPPATS